MSGKKLKIFLALTVAAIVTSCTESIDIELDEGSIRLVVDGSVTTDTTVHRIKLARTTSFFYNLKPPPVTGAEVAIITRDNVILLTEAGAGIYETDSSFYGIEGETYDLKISLAAPVGGHSEYSATAVLNRGARLDSVSLLYRPEWSTEGFFEVRCSFQDLAGADYYRFMIYRNGKMITDTLDEWLVVDDRLFGGIYVENITVAFFDQGRENEKLAESDEITVEINTLDRNFASFLQDAQAELRGSNPLFSGPPANVRGNISNGAIGYFAAYPASRKSTKVVKKR